VLASMVSRISLITVVLVGLAGGLYGVVIGDAIAILGGVLSFVGGLVVLVSIARSCGEHL
jgi:uncharacterized membrane protein YjjP (DUF1212 family)